MRARILLWLALRLHWAARWTRRRGLNAMPARTMAEKKARFRAALDLSRRWGS